MRFLIITGLALSARPLWADEMVFPMLIETARGSIEVTTSVLDPAALPQSDCLPACVLPSVLADVETLTEAEVLAFLTGPLALGEGVVIDPRLPEVHALGTLPGAVNLPLPALGRDNPYVGDVMHALGAVTGADGVSDFTGAKLLLVHGNGPWEDEGAAAIRALLDLGYPAEKLRFYRGGIRDWMMTGLALAMPPVQG